MDHRDVNFKGVSWTELTEVECQIVIFVDTTDELPALLKAEYFVTSWINKYID